MPPDLLRCGVCRDYLCEPVSAICGHNFCAECVSQGAPLEGRSRTCCFCSKRLAAHVLPNRLLERLLEVTFSKEYALRTQRKGRQLPVSESELRKYAMKQTVRVCLWLAIGWVVSLIAVDRVHISPQVLIDLFKHIMTQQYYPSSLVWRVVSGIINSAGIHE